MADTPKTPAELAEQLLQAMKIVSDSSLNQISFDKTEICTILGKENESANNNCYFVSNGSMRFKAYVPQSTDGKQVRYKKDDSVRVSIPNGDYTKKKIIEGLSVDEDNDNPTIFVSPLETMLEITDSIVPETEAGQTYGLTANGSVEQICLWSADFDGDKKYRDIQNSDICDSIALKADFKTVFANSNVIKGHYGLRLDLYFHTTDNEDDGFYNVNQHSVYLDSANMFGNPYSFLIYSTQAIKFSIKDFGILKCANLYFYQKKDFEKLNDKGIKEIIPSKKFNNKSDKYYEARTALKLLVEEKDSEEYKSILTEANTIAEELIELCSLKEENGGYEIKDGEIIIPYKSLELDNNLLVKNLYLSFGSDIVDIDDNVFKIFCNDDLSYNEDAIATTESIDDYKELGLLWYNKDEDGKYVGFSDGIYDEDYDEIEYIKSSSADARLLAQKGRDCPYDFNGLTLAANLQDEKQLYSEIYNLINKDLYNELKAFESRFKSVIDVEPAIKNAFDIILVDNKEDKTINSINEFLEDFQERQKIVVTQYTEILKFAKAWQNAKLLGEPKPNIEDYKDIKPEYIKNDNGIDQCVDINGYIADRAFAWVQCINSNNLNAKNNIFGVLNTFVTSGGKYQSFESIYDSFKYRLQAVYDKIFKASEKIEKMVIDKKGDLGSKDVPLLNNYITNEDYDFKEYASATDQEQFKKEKDNRYCVYWFRYQPNAALPDEEPRILDKKWKRITVNEKVNGRNITNLGVPLLSLKGEDGENYNEKRDTDEILGINLDTTIKTEKIKAVLYYNHTKYESNEIEFTNLNPYTEQDAADQNGALYIEHGENSKDSYQSYGVNNCLNNAADSYTKRYLKIRFDGEQGKDEYLNDAQVFWYMPRNSTMLTYDLDDYGTDFTNDTIDTTERLIVKITKNLSSAEKTLIIDSKWVEGTQEVEWKDQNGIAWRFEGISDDDKTLYFNRGSNNLGKYTSVSIPNSLKWDYVENKVDKTLELSCNSSWEMIQKSDASIDGYYCFYRTINENADSRLFPYHISDYYSASFSQNEIICKVIPKDSTTTLEANIVFTFSSYGTSGTDYTLVIAPTGTRAAVDPNYKDELNNNLVLQAKLYDYKNEEIKIDGLNCSWIGDKAVSPYQCVVADNKIAITIEQISNNGQIVNDTDDAQFYGVLKSQIDVTVTKDHDPTKEKDESGKDASPPTENKNSRTVTLTAFTVIPYMNDNYFIEGPSIVVYDSSGINPTYYKNPFKIFNNVTKKELDNVYWSIAYYKENGQGLNLEEEIPQEYKLSYNFMPKLGDNNELIPSSMYLGDGDSTNILYPVVLCKKWNSKESKMDTIWAQPIYLMQNRYPSAMINAWDGSFQIDEENGTIMSTMLGAGRKTVNNTFEGVLMGNVYQATGDNATDIGIYGYHNGAQSFNFNIDGTAFLGKAGAGRIYFNGNGGYIYSQNWLSSFGKDTLFSTTVKDDGTLYSGKAGMAIDLVNGHIDAYNFKLTSKNIYLNSNPQNNTDYYLQIGSDGTSIDASWGENADAPQTSGYLSFTRQGDLTIRANNLSITGKSGGSNLLKQTKPQMTVPRLVEGTTSEYQKDENGKPIYDWDVSKWRKSAGVAVAGNATAIDGKIFYLTVTGGNYQISQDVDYIYANQYYTLSGYINSNSDSEQTLTISPESSEPLLPWNKDKHIVKYKGKNNWTYFEYTFKIKNDFDGSFNLLFTGSTNYNLWHLMLEEGTIANTWRPANDDVADDIVTQQENYDKYLNQDKVFERLITDPKTGQKMDGIYLDSSSGHPELYINASYMATGILRSKNWNGTITKTDSGKTNKYGQKIYNYGINDTSATAGVYFNLDLGKMWAANFDLKAGTLGNTNFLGLSSNGISYSGSIGNSAKNKSWRIIAGNNFGVDTYGNVFMSGTIDATAGKIAGWHIIPNWWNAALLYSPIGDWKTGMASGLDGFRAYSYPAFWAGYKSDKYDTPYHEDDANQSTLPGKGNCQFYVSHDGYLVAKNAVIKGTSSIGGWKVSGTSISSPSGKIILDSAAGTITSSNSDGSKTFTINNQGSISANSGDIGGWNISSGAISSSPSNPDIILAKSVLSPGNDSEDSGVLHAEIQLNGNGKIRCSQGSDIVINGGTLDCRHNTSEGLGSALDETDEEYGTTGNPENRLRGIVINPQTSLRIFRGKERAGELGAESIHFGYHLKQKKGKDEPRDPGLIKLFHKRNYPNGVNNKDNYVVGYTGKAEAGTTIYFVEGICIGTSETDYNKFAAGHSTSE